jgi:hypothetical protein
VSKKGLPFLPLFLSVTAVAFALAVALRARTYIASTSPSASSGGRGAVTADASGASLHRDGTDAPGDVAGATAAGSTQQVSSLQTSSPDVVLMSPEERARRRSELLAQPLNAAVTTSPVVQKPPVLLQGPPAAKALPPPPPPVQRPPQTRASTNPNSNPMPNAAQSDPRKGTGDDTPRQPKDPKDPSSDTTPPQLLSAAFNPPQVHDGEEGTIIITATDDISGIRSISGTVTSPSSKALQGFSCQPDPQIQGQFIGKVAIPKDAEEGQWRVNFISLSDNASNTANLHINSGGIPASAVLNVISSAPDKTPPTLRRVWLDRTQMKGGERNIVYIEADDDKSGVKFASGVFQSPAKLARVSFGCAQGQTPSQWTCSLSVPAMIDCGPWQLEQVQLQDGANNMATVRSDNPIVAQVKLTLFADSCDNTPPVLQSLTLNPRVVSNQAGSILVSAVVSDDLSGVYGVMAQAVGPGQGSGRWFPLAAGGENSSIWTGRFDVPVNAGKGTWRISFVQVIDKANNLKLYTQSDPPLSGSTFTVQ